MFCTKCGYKITGQARFCPACGRALDSASTVSLDPASAAAVNALNPASTVVVVNTRQPEPMHEQVSSHLALAILTTLCCCLPFGIVAIVYAAQVDNHLSKGDVTAAKNASDNAMTWLIIAWVVGVLFFGVFLLG